MRRLIAKLVLLWGAFFLLMAALFGLRVGAALLIWTGVALALGLLFILAMRKIKRRMKFLAERGDEYEIVGDFTLLKERDNEPR